jgi:hypothetical protein
MSTYRVVLPAISTHRWKRDRPGAPKPTAGPGPERKRWRYAQGTRRYYCELGLREALERGHDVVRIVGHDGKLLDAFPVDRVCGNPYRWSEKGTYRWPKAWDKPLPPYPRGA